MVTSCFVLETSKIHFYTLDFRADQHLVFEWKSGWEKLNYTPERKAFKASFFKALEFINFILLSTSLNTDFDAQLRDTIWACKIRIVEVCAVHTFIRTHYIPNIIRFIRFLFSLFNLLTVRSCICATRNFTLEIEWLWSHTCSNRSYALEQIYHSSLLHFNPWKHARLAPRFRNKLRMSVYKSTDNNTYENNSLQHVICLFCWRRK